VPATLDARWPVLGLGLALLSLAAWCYGLALRALDPLCVVGLLAGLGCSGAALVRGDTVTTRRLAVLGVGANLAGISLLLLVYSAG
jgi:hypothetical protein